MEQQSPRRGSAAGVALLALAGAAIFLIFYLSTRGSKVAMSLDGFDVSAVRPQHSSQATPCPSNLFAHNPGNATTAFSCVTSCPAGSQSSKPGDFPYPGAMVCIKDSIGMIIKEKGLADPIEWKPIDCGEPRAIRAFKNLSMGLLVGTGPAGTKTSDDWARCLCGKSADNVGFDEPPVNPDVVPAGQTCDGGLTKEQCAARDAVQYFKKYLPVSDQEALRLGRCSWGLAAEPTPAQAKPAPSHEEVEWVLMPGGRFLMGADNAEGDATPIHEVAVKTFEISRTPVTVEQYAECVIKGQCARPDMGAYCNWGKTGRQRHPINCVNWKDAHDFARFKNARLPSEAEYEYAATSRGKNRPYEPKPTCENTVMHGKGGYGCGSNSTMPVCSKPTGNTEQGLCDMLGNVEAWTEDMWCDSYVGAPTDGSAWEDASGSMGHHWRNVRTLVLRGGRYVPGTLRVTRGGSYYLTAVNMRVDRRGFKDPASNGEGVGIRLARSRR